MRGAATGELGLFLFTVDLDEARRARQAGVDALVVDWEWRGKTERQDGADTEINRDTPRELAALKALAPLRRCCRVNAFGDWTAEEIELAVDGGATDVLLPMVERPAQVEAFLRLLDGRARAGILVETIQACERAEELARLPLNLVYLGLNDLALQQGKPCIFGPLVDGTAERLRQIFCEAAFGFGGLTVVDAGFPVPCRRLLEEMARLGCDYSFLRRSFKRDIVDRDMAHEVRGLRTAWKQLCRRDVTEVAADHAALRRTLDAVFVAGDRSA